MSDGQMSFTCMSDTVSIFSDHLCRRTLPHLTPISHAEGKHSRKTTIHFDDTCFARIGFGEIFHITNKPQELYFNVYMYMCI